MYKEVGASGQISLGKKYAGQMFDVQFLESGAVQMLPVRVVPVSLEMPSSPAKRSLARQDGQTRPALASSAEFQQQFGAWIIEMNQMVEQHGVWSDGLMEAEQQHGAV